jgi:hypothetical protein
MDRLYADTKLGDTATRLAWLDKSPAEFEASTDPFIQLAVAMYPATSPRAEAKERAGKLQAARSAYMRGMLAFAEARAARSIRTPTARFASPTAR